MNGGTAPVAQFQMAGDEAGVEVGEEDVADLKAKSRSVGQVLLDIALGGDDNRGRTGLISEQIGSVERFRAPGVMESVGEELYETATFARLVDCGERKLAGIQDKIIEIRDRGYCILREHFARPMIDACRSAFWPVLLAYLKAHGHEPNRGPHRHFLPMPFEPPCFVPDFFFDNEVLSIVRGSMDDRVVADQWGCDVPLRDSDYQGVHVDYQRPLFSEAPDLSLPAYVLVVSFGLVRITPENGPIEIAPGTHRMPRKEALRAVEAAETGMQPVPLEIGDVLIRHPWVLHRGSPNTTDTPRALVSIRYVRPWYADSSREVDSLPRAVWDSLTPEQQQVMRFPVGDRSLPIRRAE